jgi:hypothetical protein
MPEWSSTVGHHCSRGPGGRRLRTEASGSRPTVAPQTGCGPDRIGAVRDREHSKTRVRSSWGQYSACLGGLLIVTACTSPPRSPAAASNEDFSTGNSRDGLPSEVDDRWASIVLDEQQRAEVRTILVEAAQDPGDVRPLVPAAHGVRFEDVPHAMLNAAPMVEMAILRTRHLPPTIQLEVRDAAGRMANVEVLCRPRGTLATISYRIPGLDVMGERGEILAAVNAVILSPDASSDPNELADPLAHALAELGVKVLDQTIMPERYRYTLLMLDEQEASIEIRREPPPTAVSWTASAGTFPRPEIAQRLGETLMDRLRAWGEVPRVEPADAASEDPRTASAGE